VSEGPEWSPRNQAVFRSANEELRELNARLLDERGERAFAAMPFLCECGRASCTRVVRLTVAEYDRVRGREACFVVLPGHAGPDRVVAEGERFLVVEQPGSDERSRVCA
jgi:hypothetical protein